MACAVKAMATTESHLLSLLGTFLAFCLPDESERVTPASFKAATERAADKRGRGKRS